MYKLIITIESQSGLSTALACVFALLADYLILPPLLLLVSKKEKLKA